MKCCIDVLLCLLSILGGPLDDLQSQHDQDQSAWEDHDDVAGSEEVAHSTHEDTIDLANLGELERGRCTCKQEANDDEDGIVKNADWDELRNQRQHGCHDDRRQDHAGEQGRVEKSALFGLGFWCGGKLILRQGRASKVGAEDHQNERHCNAT